MHVLRAVDSVTCIVLSIAVEVDDLLDEVGSYVRMLRKHVFDAAAQMRAVVSKWRPALVRYLICSSSETGRHLQHWDRSRHVKLWLLLQGSESSSADKEGTHVVGTVRVGIDVLQAIAGCRHVLLTIVVTDKIHDCEEC